MTIDRKRRRMLELVGAAGAVALAGCADDRDEEPGDGPGDDGAGNESDGDGADNESDGDGAGNESDEDDAPEGGRLTVLVTDLNGDPVEDATVLVTGGELEGEEQTTDADGEAVYEGLTEDIYEVEVQAVVEDEEFEQRGQVPVDEDSDITRTFALGPEEED